MDYYGGDGFSGTHFNHPYFQRMISDLDANATNTVITKDLSCFGKGFLGTGIYLEKYFLDKDIRFIAPSDNVVLFCNILNDAYTRDVHRKTKSAFDTQFS